ALLLPFACALWSQVRTRTRRTVLRLVAAGSMIPVIFSLNRTLWLCLIVTLVYGGARFAARGKKGSFQAICAVAIVGYLLFNFGPTGQLIADRANTPHSNQGRSILYSEAADSVEKSPLLGYGGPKPSVVNPNLPPVGTQGQFWLVFFSHGFPGLGPARTAGGQGDGGNGNAGFGSGRAAGRVKGSDVRPWGRAGDAPEGWS